MIRVGGVVDGICEALGVDKATVTSIVIEPNTLTAHVLVKNESGRLFVDPATGATAVEKLTLAVAT